MNEQSDAVMMSFNDLIYRETGINRNSVALREVDLLNAEGFRYVLQVIKRNVNNLEQFYVMLKDAFGKTIPDLSVSYSGSVSRLDLKCSQDSVVIEVPDSSSDVVFEVSSKSASIATTVSIEREKERAQEDTAAHEHERNKARDSKRNSEGNDQE